MVEIKGIRFDVEIQKKRIRNIYLRVEGNKILATCPYYVAKYEVYNFIETKKDWIYKAYVYNANKKNNTLLYRGGDIFYIFNEKYQLIFSVGKSNVSIVDKCIYLTYKEVGEDAIKYLYKTLDTKLLSLANEYLDSFMPVLNDYGYNLRPILKARILKSKWGVCFTRKNSINISSYLIHYPTECLKYIILHEMVHFIIPNHSKRFYEIVSNNMPDYKEVNKLLR